MSNTNTNLQTQTSNALHNAIIKAGGKDHPPIIHPTNSNGLRRQFQLLKAVQKPLQKGIDNDIYSTVDACLNACEMWKAIERLKQGESINVQDLETNLYWELGKFTSRDGESLESYYSRSQQAATRTRGKVIVNSSLPTYDQEPTVVAEDDEMSKDKEIDKLMALISLSFKKIYKPTNYNLRTSSNTSRANQDNTLRINRGTRYDNQRVVNVAGARKNVVGYEHVAMNLVSQLESGTFTSIFKYPALKQLAIKRGDEYGFVIRPGLVGVTFKSVRIDL
ncbi:hypothetical protein Tco_0645477 [Tanacetum coccineum]